ncbi:MAG: magnesium/cobalt transporter CorA [Chloroflexi bacterium]|nr:magnesium/cobalt transporter CorA [Chloroflexota bacterium]
MIRSLYRAHDGQVRANVRPDQFAAVLQDAHGLLWVDLMGEPPAACAPILHDTFGFHPLAVDDALEETHVPKVDDWGAYIYLVLHAVVFDVHGVEPLHTLELDVFLGSNYLVTYRTRPISAVDRVWAACQRDERHLQRGAARLLYQLADELVADYMPVVEGMDETIDQIEDQIFDSPGPSLLERIFTLKRGLLRLRRMIAPQREVLNKLARGDYAIIGEEDRVFFRDVYDHLVRLHDITESLRDLLGGALDTYLLVISNRMNEVMKTLTLITTLFMPVSFLTGFFGMNFFQPVLSLEAWTGRMAFLLLLATMVLLPAGMYLWMRRRAWM